MGLQDYQRKRDFERTREPNGLPSPPGGGVLRYVVQKHAARRLHYDFRLEIDGVLKSWAVAKGPDLDPNVKRLAVQVEDHPLDYGGFEGIIPKGSYGAGEVIVWDRGGYVPDDMPPNIPSTREAAEQHLRTSLQQGKLSFTLYGHKLHGSWTLVRSSRAEKDWLLIKHRDAYADAKADVLADERSVLSGLTIKDLRSGRLPRQHMGIPPEAVRAIEQYGRQAPFPRSVEPMLASLAEKSFSHPEWLFEPKLDGYRITAYLKDNNVVLRSRGGLDYTRNFPQVVDGLKHQPEGELVLDGEVVALDDEGHPSFELLQGYTERDHEKVRLVYYVFDLLYQHRRDLRRVPLFARKALLSHTLVPNECIQLVETVEGEGEMLLRAAADLGLEGIVAKRRDSPYEASKRSKAWLKVKRVSEDDFVIGGWTTGQRAREQTLGSLLLGYYENGLLRFAGRAGTGFDQQKLEDMRRRLEHLQRKSSPFADTVPLEGAEAHWVKPELVARVKYAERTRDNRLRAPVFVALREDLKPDQVIREMSELPPSPPATSHPSRQTSLHEILEQLSAAKDRLTLQIEGHRLTLTNLSKPLWPGDKGVEPVTKRELIAYYIRMSSYLLAHLKDRPITLTRYPNGIHQGSFYQKHWPGGKPDFVDTVRVFSSHSEGDVDFLMANNLATLTAFAQQAAIELHPWNSRVSLDYDADSLPQTFTGSEEAVRASVLNYPDFIVFDLDPYIYSGKEKAGAEPELNRKAFLKTVEMARELKAILDQLSLSTFVKTSGKTGLHIYVPVLRHYRYDVVRKACETIGRFLLRQFPKDITMEWSVAKRTGKIFLDHNQNVRGKNMASIYSLRPVPGAPVSTPVQWQELDDLYPLEFNIRTVPSRVEAIGDLWSSILNAKHDLRALLEPDSLPT